MRIALIVPSSNVQAERDYQAHLPPDCSVHSARLYFPTTTAEAERAMLEVHLDDAVRDLATCGPDVAVFVCTSAGALLGRAGEAALVRSIAGGLGCPVVSTNAAVHDKIRALGARRLAVVTPYTAELTQAVVAGVEELAVEVVAGAGMGILDPLALSRIPTGELLDFAADTVRGHDVDAVFVSCSNIRSFEIHDRLAALVGKPVISSNRASFEAALNAVGVENPLSRRASSALT